MAMDMLANELQIFWQKNSKIAAEALGANLGKDKSHERGRPVCPAKGELSGSAPNASNIVST